MHYSTVRNHLKPYTIVARRKTTINHAFAAAIAPNDEYNEKQIRDAVSILGQNPDQDLLCAYCGESAQTWDHIFATVKKSNFSGYGHRLGNLLPCCKFCNSSKGNKNWRLFLDGLKLPNDLRKVTEHRIDVFLSKYSVQDPLPEKSAEFTKLLQIKDRILELLAEADQLAKSVRKQAI